MTKEKEQKTAKEQKRIDEVKAETRKRVSGYIVAGFALVGGLAWNDAIRSTIDIWFPQGGAETILAKFIYAIIITVIIAIVSIYVTKLLIRDEESKK